MQSVLPRLELLRGLTMPLSYALTDNLTSRSKTWKLNESLLQDEEVLKDNVKELDCYFRTKDTPDSSPGIV